MCFVTRRPPCQGGLKSKIQLLPRKTCIRSGEAYDAAGQQLLDRLDLAVGLFWLAATLAAQFTGDIQPNAGALYGQLTFDFGESDPDVKEESARWCPDVDGIGKALQLDVLLVQLTHQIDQVLDTAAQTVEFPHYKSVARTHKVRPCGRIRQTLREAKRNGTDTYAAIESVVPWDDSKDFDFPYRIGESHTTLQRYAAKFLCGLKLRPALATKGLLDAVEVPRMMNAAKARALPGNTPAEFIKPR